VVKEGQGQNSTQRTSRWQVKGTAQVDYGKDGGQANTMLRLVGYFPADNPKFCIVVVHKPSTVNNNYGADVAGFFKRIAQKIFRCSFDKRNKNIDRKSLNRKKIITTTLLNYKSHSSQFLMLKGCQEWMRLFYWRI
jgi:cell division protein FtsI (penicillin-binding protein 3)